jgi:hypothetical protein
MNRYFIIPAVISLLGILGCRPNLVVKPDPEVDYGAKTVKISVSNIGKKTAGTQLTYIEINAVDANDADKPQSQFSVSVPAINAGDTWESDEIHFSKFSSPRGLDLMTLTEMNLVVRADAKNMVKESNEQDNVYDADR